MFARRPTQKAYGGHLLTATLQNSCLFSQALKMWAYKKLQNLLYSDLERTAFLWRLVNDIYTARALAQFNPAFFKEEEKLWWRLRATGLPAPSSLPPS